MPEFVAIDLTGEQPEGICTECLARDGVLHGPMQTMLVYCPHNGAGAYRVLDRPWKTLRSVNAKTFLEVMCRGLTMGELRVDLERDLQLMLDRAETRH